MSVVDTVPPFREEPPLKLEGEERGSESEPWSTERLRSAAAAVKCSEEEEQS